MPTRLGIDRCSKLEKITGIRRCNYKRCLQYIIYNGLNAYWLFYYRFWGEKNLLAISQNHRKLISKIINRNRGTFHSQLKFETDKGMLSFI